MLAAIPMTMGWLAEQGGGYAAIVCAEKWSHTIDRRSSADRGLWGHADGAGAFVVGFDVADKPLVTFLGAEFSSHSAFNGLVLIKYGGTRHPIAPPDAPPSARTLRPVPGSELWAAYRTGYECAISKLVSNRGVRPHRLICNQISPRIVSMVGELANVPEARTCRSGERYGHVGAADTVIGLRQLIDQGLLDGPVLVAGSTPYAFGAGLLLPGA
jgi:3-oxoacyl-[acyl-carrier-protein] synthase III